MQMSEAMNVRPVVAQRAWSLRRMRWPMPGSQFEELLATEGGNVLAETLPLWLAGR